MSFGDVYALIEEGLLGIVGWIGDVINALFSTNGAWSAVLPLILLGVGVSFVMLGVRIYKWVTTFV